MPTIRFYESAGLIPPATRASNGRRTYGWPDVSRLSFVRRARDFGLSVQQVKGLLTLNTGSDADCEPAKAILSTHLADIRKKRDDLERLERSLEKMLERCGPSCCAEAQLCSIFTDIEASEG